MNGSKKQFAKTALTLMVVAAILAMTLGMKPAHASPGSSGARLHPMGALFPKKQVDAVLRTKGAALQATLPASVNLSAYDVPVKNQDPQGIDIGSCVTWAIDYAMLGWYSNHDAKPGQPFNPMYTYSQLDNGVAAAGSRPADVLNYAYNQGNDTSAHYSHSYWDYTDQPNAAERLNAANYKITGWQALFQNTGGVGDGLTGENAIKNALGNELRPVAIGLLVRPGFDNMAHTDIADSDISGAIRGGLGGHEVLAVGYNANGLLIQNSWGTGWGFSGGYGRLSWAVVEHDVFQAHVISGIKFASGSAGDVTPPTMGAVTDRFSLGHQVTSTTEPVNFKWAATDASGVSAYAVYVKTDGGQWVQDTTIASSATGVTYSLSIGHSYQVAVAAKDSAGNWSGYSYSSSVKPGVSDDSTFSIASPWARYNLADTYGGTYTATSQAGAGLSTKFTGQDIALIGPKFSTAGRATLYCDGTSSGLIDEYNASTVGRQVVAWCHFAQSGQHTMKIVVEGTAGRPWFGVDAFTFLP